MILDDLAIPIVLAPMAGGPTTPRLVAAVAEAGGFAFLAAGYLTAAALGEQIEQARALTSAPLGVNVFVPGAGGPADPAPVAAYAAVLAEEARAAGVALGTARFDDDDWAAKIDLLVEARMPVVSFTFGCPDAAVFDRLHAAGSEVWVTVTRPEEAERAAAAGADALIAQGAEAGGHRGAFSDDPADDLSDGIGLLSLLQLIRARSGPSPIGARAGLDSIGAGAGLSSAGTGVQSAGAETGLPLVAAGGIATGAGIAAALAAGADAAQLGTAFLRCPEAGTAEVQRKALASDAPTAMTRAFTGRTARGIRNRFLDAHSAGAPDAYPEVHFMTAPLRRAGRESGNPDLVNLWAGQTHVLGRDLPAGQLVRVLAEEAREAVRKTAERFG